MAIAAERRIVMMAPPTMLIGDIFAKAAMADVDVDETASLRDHAADGGIGAQGHHGRALPRAHGPEIHRHAAIVIGIMRMAAIAPGCDFQLTDMADKSI